MDLGDPIHRFDEDHDDKDVDDHNNLDHLHQSKRMRLNEYDPDEDNNNIDANQIAALCYEEYLRLGKSGKPDPSKNEHTVLAGIVEIEKSDNIAVKRVVALSTGTKCFPANIATRHVDIVDCHAESLLKRAFKRYLIEQIDRWLAVAGKRIEQYRKEVLSKRKYCLFVSQTPCGCRSRWEGNENGENAKLTGRTSFRSVGVNRKPGRGEHCPKSACIHKLAKWFAFGLQGKWLLRLIGSPIVPYAIVIGDCDQPKMRNTESNYLISRNRSILDRLTIDRAELRSIETQLRRVELFNFAQGILLKFAHEFRYEPFVREAEIESSGATKRAAGSSIVAWLKEDNQLEISSSKKAKTPRLQCEILAAGRKLGAARPKSGEKEEPLRQQLQQESNKSGVIITLRSSSEDDENNIIDQEQPQKQQHRVERRRRHRPADLAVSDIALRQCVHQLIVKCISPISPRERRCDDADIDDHDEDVNDSKMSDEEDLTKNDRSSTISSARRCTVAMLDDKRPTGNNNNTNNNNNNIDQMIPSSDYEHNWKILKRTISIFRGWPSIDDPSNDSTDYSSTRSKS